MAKITGCIFRKRRPAVSGGFQCPRSLAILFLCFLAGSAAGAFLGGGALTEVSLGAAFSDGSVYASAGYWELLFSCARYPAAVLLFGTSLLGVVLIPCALAFRGFVFSCTAGAIAGAYPGLRGTALCAAVLGLPALLVLPCLFFAGTAALEFSGKLLSGAGRRPGRAILPDGALRLFLCVPALCAAACVEAFAVPPLVRLILSL